MREKSSSAVRWVMNCKVGEGEERSGGMMRILSVLEQIGGWHFKAKRVVGMEDVLAHGITRRKGDQIKSRGWPQRIPRRYVAGPGTGSGRGGNAFRGFRAQLHTSTSGEVDSEDLWAKLEDMGELEVMRGKIELVGQAGGRVAVGGCGDRVHGVLRRADDKSGGDRGGEVDCGIVLPRAVGRLSLPP